MSNAVEVACRAAVDFDISGGIWDEKSEAWKEYARRQLRASLLAALPELSEGLALAIDRAGVDMGISELDVNNYGTSWEQDGTPSGQYIAAAVIEHMRSQIEEGRNEGMSKMKSLPRGHICDARDQRTEPFTEAEFGNAWAVHRGSVFGTHDLTPFQEEWKAFLAAELRNAKAEALRTAIEDIEEAGLDVYATNEFVTWLGARADEMEGEGR